MGISGQDNSRTFVATGTAVPVSIAFKWAVASDLVVTRLVAGADSADDGAPLTMGSDYAIGGNGRANPPTGFLTEIGLEAGRTYRIERATEQRQKYIPKMGVAGSADAMEHQLDDMVMGQQDDRAFARDLQARSWLLPRGETAGVLPPAAARQGKFRAWGPDGKEVPAAGIGGDDGLRQTIVSQFGAAYTGKREGGSVQDAIDDIGSRAAKATVVAAGTGLIGGGPLKANIALSGDFASDAEAEAGVATDKLLSPATGKALVDAETAGIKLAIANGTVAALVTVTEATQADLYLNTAPADGAWAIIYDDATAENNGFYRRDSGAAHGWQGPLLQDAFQANAAEILADAEAARDAAIAQNAGGALGDLKVKTADVDGAVDWLARPSLANQPVLHADFTLTGGNPDGGQLARTAGTSPTYAADGDQLKITSPGTTFAWAGILLPMTVAPGRIFEVTYSVSALDVSAGVGIGFTATPPVVGGPAVLDLPVDFGGMVWRLGGTAVRAIYDRTGAADTVPLDIADQSNGGLQAADVAAGPGETAGFRVEFDATGTAARLIHIVNGRPLRGISDVYTDLTGIPAGAYIWVGLHGGIQAPDDVLSVGPAALYSSAIDIPRGIYADATILIGGTGSQDDPLLAPDEVARFIALDRNRRQFRIRLKGGVYDKPLVIPDASFIDELVIEAPQGEKCIIQPADLIEGDGLWEPVSGQANLWRRPAVFGGDTSLALGNASIIEVPGAAFPNLVQTVGAGGWTHSYPWAIYTRRPNEYALASLNGEPGSYCVHMAGTHAGYLIVHARGSADPNDLAFRRPLENNAVAVLCADPAAWNLTRVIVDGIEGRFTYSDIFRFERARVEHGPLVARASSTGHGFQYNECVARGYWPVAEGIAGDGYNMNGSFGDLPLDLEPWTGLWSAKALGSPKLATSFGDGFSNHEHQKVSLFDFTAIGMGKDGLSAGGDFSVNGASFLGCDDSGVKLYGVTGTANRGTLRNVHVAGCCYGIANLQNQAGGSGLIDAYDMLFEAIGLYAVYANKPGGDSAIINLRGRQDYTGAAPGTGYYGGDGTITRQDINPMPVLP